MSSLADIVVSLRLDTAQWAEEAAQAAKQAQELSDQITESTRGAEAATQAMTQATQAQTAANSGWLGSLAQIVSSSASVVSVVRSIVWSLEAGVVVLGAMALAALGMVLAFAAIPVSIGSMIAGYIALKVAIAALGYAWWALTLPIRGVYILTVELAKLGFWGLGLAAQEAFSLIKTGFDQLQKFGLGNTLTALGMIAMFIPGLQGVALAARMAGLALTVAYSAPVQDAIRLQNAHARTAEAWGLMGQFSTRVLTGQAAGLRQVTEQTQAAQAAFESMRTGNARPPTAKEQRAEQWAMEDWKKANDLINKNFKDSKSSYESVSRFIGSLGALGGEAYRSLTDSLSMISAHVISLSGVPSILKTIHDWWADDRGFRQFFDNATRAVNIAKHRLLEFKEMMADWYVGSVYGEQELGGAKKIREQAEATDASIAKLEKARTAMTWFNAMQKEADKHAEESAELAKIKSIETVAAIEKEIEAYQRKTALLIFDGKAATDRAEKIKKMEGDIHAIQEKSKPSGEDKKKLQTLKDELEVLKQQKDKGEEFRAVAQKTYETLLQQKQAIQSGTVKREIDQLLEAAEKANTTANNAGDDAGIGRANELVKQGKATAAEAATLEAVLRDTEAATEAKRQAKAVDEALAEAKKRLAVAQMGESEALIIKARENNATADQIEKIRQLTAEFDKLAEAKKRTQEAEKANERADTEIGKLTDEIARLKGQATETTQAMRDLKKAGADQEKIDQLSSLTRERDALKSKTEETKKLAEEAKRLKEALRTPAEAFEADMKKYRELHQLGMINDEDLRRAERKAGKDHFGAGDKTDNTAALSGSSEALKIIFQRANPANRMESLAERQAVGIEKLVEKSDQQSSDRLVVMSIEGAA